MAETGGDALRAEVAALRREVAELREEQQAVARTVEELASTFRSIAVQLGIGSGTYQRRATESSARELPGFG